jgi:hypothetical protein
LADSLALQLFPVSMTFENAQMNFQPGPVINLSDEITKSGFCGILHAAIKSRPQRAQAL